MVNHHSRGVLNVVHAYNRTLNDVFEEDSINEISQMEGGIDVQINSSVTTFLLFAAGQFSCRGEIVLKLKVDGAEHTRKVSLFVPRFCHFDINLKEVFDDLGYCEKGILFVSQPTQLLFFGRMLVGRRRLDQKGFSANHSYYVMSSHHEYWGNNRSSQRQYPFFQGLSNAVRFYPIMSPSILRIEISVRDLSGLILTTSDMGNLQSPEGCLLEASINEICEIAGINTDTVGSFTVSATPLGGNTPARINHQLVYNSGGLDLSVNMSLSSPNVFQPKGKHGFIWGQVAIASGYYSLLGVTLNSPDQGNVTFVIDFYGESGCFHSDTVSLLPGAVYTTDLRKELTSFIDEELGSKPIYIWYCIRSERSDIYAYSVTKELISGDCTGEHAF
jgi:hypothetical protein